MRRVLEKLEVDVDWEGAGTGLLDETFLHPLKSTEGEGEDGRMRQLGRKCHNVKQALVSLLACTQLSQMWKCTTTKITYTFQHFQHTPHTQSLCRIVSLYLSHFVTILVVLCSILSFPLTISSVT